MSKQKILLYAALILLPVLLTRFILNQASSLQPVQDTGLAAGTTSEASAETQQSTETQASNPPVVNALTDEERNAKVRTKDLAIGNSKIIVEGSQLKFHIRMQLMDGRVVFDSYKENRPWDGIIGNGSLIAGLDIGLRGMMQGGKRALWIPPILAYGKYGINPQVPPNSKLYAEVELLSVF